QARSCPPPWARSVEGGVGGGFRATVGIPEESPFYSPFPKTARRSRTGQSGRPDHDRRLGRAASQGEGEGDAGQWLDDLANPPVIPPSRRRQGGAGQVSPAGPILPSPLGAQRRRGSWRGIQGSGWTIRRIPLLFLLPEDGKGAQDRSVRPATGRQQHFLIGASG